MTHPIAMVIGGCRGGEWHAAHGQTLLIQLPVMPAPRLSDPMPPPVISAPFRLARVRVRNETRYYYVPDSVPAEREIDFVLDWFEHLAEALADQRRAKTEGR